MVRLFLTIVILSTAIQALADSNFYNPALAHVDQVYVSFNSKSLDRENLRQIYQETYLFLEKTFENEMDILVLDPMVMYRLAPVKNSVIFQIESHGDGAGFVLKSWLAEHIELENARQTVTIWKSEQVEIELAEDEKLAQQVGRNLMVQARELLKDIRFSREIGELINPPGEEIITSSISTSESEPAAAKAENQNEAAGADFLASKNSKIFHKADCGNAERIAEDNRVVYSSRAEAHQDGKRPCKICKP